MRINDNGVYRDMTPEEVRAMEEEMAQIPPPAPDPMQERFVKLEKENEELWLALAQFELGGDSI